MTLRLIAFTSLLALVGCGGSLNTSIHSAADYYRDDQLRSEALHACQADSEAALAVNMKKPVCVNALAAQHNHDFNLGAPE